MTWLIIVAPVAVLFMYELGCALREEWRRMHQLPPWIEPGRTRRGRR